MCLKESITSAPEGQANKLIGTCRKQTLKKTLLSVLASKIQLKNNWRVSICIPNVHF